MKVIIGLVIATAADIAGFTERAIHEQKYEKVIKQNDSLKVKCSPNQKCK